MTDDLMPDVDELLGMLKQSVTDPDKQVILQDVATQAVRLTKLALTDPAAAAASFDDVKAIMGNLGSAEVSNVAMIWTEWATNAVTRIITKVMPI